MGTNYYIHQNTCPHCGRSDEPLHIGKSSAGWCFALHVYPEKGIMHWADFQTLNGTIKDENGNELTWEEMIKIILDREVALPSLPLGYESWDQFHCVNHSERGPFGLLRSEISKNRICIGHGEGPWDLIVGDFS